MAIARDPASSPDPAEGPAVSESREAVERSVAQLAALEALTEALHPPVLGDELTESAWVRTDSVEEAIVALKELLGEEVHTEEEWSELPDLLTAEYLRPEAVPEDHDLYSYMCEEQATSSPVWWVKAEEEDPASALYWRYEVY